MEIKWWWSNFTIKFINLKRLQKAHILTIVYFMDNLDTFGCFTDYLNKRLSFQNSHKKTNYKKNTKKSVQCVFNEIELIVG